MTLNRGAEFPSEAARQVDQCGFGQAVDDLLFEGAGSAGIGDVNHASRASLRQPGGGGLGEQQGRPNIERHLRIEAVSCNVLEGFEYERCCRIDQHVQRAPFRDNSVNEACGCVAFPKVGKVDEPLVEEVAALVEYALKPGADRLDVLVASEASHVENAAAAAQLLKCACAAISSNEDPAALVFVEPPSVNRRLAATDAPTASSETEYYSLEEIRNYQIALWTAIALISVLLSAVLFLACMRPEYDSLLYATFQANVGDHFGKEN